VAIFYKEASELSDPSGTQSIAAFLSSVLSHVKGGNTAQIKYT